MHVTEFLLPQHTFLQVQSGNKEQVLQKVSELFTQQLPQLNAQTIFAHLIMREKLGSTGIGHGVAIPHARIDSLTRPYGIFLQLGNPIDFNAGDHHCVDLIFALIVPQEANETHLQILSTLAQYFSEDDFRSLCRQARDTKTLYDLITNQENSCV
jgi:PTS system nitrogen regulatory IIA component